ncbi:MAG: type III-B CRISPR module-associated Cmr3 family protein, partial [Bryobacterales bacterium]|nr:type III-B CRISPR module-associated Cmr3 family protein [Bryobacterales bacterium]
AIIKAKAPKEAGTAPVVRAVQPVALPAAAATLLDSYPLPLRPVLAEKSRGKPESGYWLTERALRDYMAGRVPRAADLVKSADLWKTDARVGVGLDPDKRSAAEGRLFTAEAVAMVRRLKPGNQEGFDVGFLVGVAGCEPPREGMLRVGGDGRAMAVYPLDGYELPEPDHEAIVRARRCRMILASPGIFAGGWLPTGVEQVNGEYRFELHGVSARLVAACVPRAGWISGWDLARERPKPALRVAPTGSVYWLDDLEASAKDLRALIAAGLWSELYLDPVRRAEGFNRIWLAEWTKQD